MFKEIGQFASIMKQAQGMQGRIAESKERIAKLEVQGEAGSGMVTVTLNGTMRMIGCHINPQLVSTGNPQLLENLVMAATNEAMEKLLAEQAREMNAITGGMNLPGISDALGGFGSGK